MTPCPICHDKGYTSAPYIAPHLFTMTACTCAAGKAFAAQWAKPQAKKDDDNVATD